MHKNESMTTKNFFCLKKNQFCSNHYQVTILSVEFIDEVRYTKKTKKGKIDKKCNVAFGHAKYEHTKERQRRKCLTSVELRKFVRMEPLSISHSDTFRSD